MIREITLAMGPLGVRIVVDWVTQLVSSFKFSSTIAASQIVCLTQWLLFSVDCPKIDKNARQVASGRKDALATGEGYGGDW